MTRRFPLPARLVSACLSMACLSVTALASPIAAAQNIDRLYPGDQFDGLMYQPRQSTGDPAYESILKDLRDANFEPLAFYDRDDPVRKLAEPVGLLKVLLKSNEYLTCTASVIDKDLILTNWHCLPKYGGQVAKAALWMGFYSDDDQGVVRYEVNTRPVESDKDLDYAILRVTGDVAGAWGRVRLSPEDPPGNRSLSLVHHPAGRPKQLTQRSCRTAAPPMVQDRLRHKCDTLPGSSGAPVFFGSGADAAMVALHFAGVPQSLQGVDPTLEANRAAPVSRLVAKSPILKRLAATPASAPAAIVAPAPQPAATSPGAPGQATTPARTPQDQFGKRPDFVHGDRLIALAEQGYVFCGQPDTAGSCASINTVRRLSASRVEVQERALYLSEGLQIEATLTADNDMAYGFWCSGLSDNIRTSFKIVNISDPSLKALFDRQLQLIEPQLAESTRNLYANRVWELGGRACAGASGAPERFTSTYFDANGQIAPPQPGAPPPNAITTAIRGSPALRPQQTN